MGSLPLHVLIADDDAVSRFVIRAAVEGLGHVCTVAQDASAALASFERERPSVLITRWGRPGPGATSLIGQIRERGAAGYTYVIALTGEGDAEAALEAMQAGADELIHPPLDAAALEPRLVSARRVLDAQEQLRAEVRVDALTALPNRRAMTEELAVLRMRAARYGHELAAVLFDLDRFKPYNEGGGHPAGDRLLARVAATLKASLRGSDSLYRCGAEEFLALLPGQDIESAGVAGERVLRAVRELAIEHPAGGQVTISAGIATLCAGESSEQLLARAHAALQEAKLAGRDCVRSSSELAAPSSELPAPAGELPGPAPSSAQ